MRNKHHILAILLALGMATLSCNPSNQPEEDTGKPVAPAKSPKRGVAFNFTIATDLPLLSPYLSWAYNWGNTQLDDAAYWFDASGMDYCPMTWNNSYNADAIRDYVKAHPNTRYLLAYNEPNLTDQANMTPAEAAAQWANVVALAKELNLKLVSPAMNYGTLPDYGDPIKWLDEFFTQPGVSIDDIYAISVHCYMASPSALQSYIERFAKYGKPIWMTEFCAYERSVSSVESQMDYMCSVLNYMEQSPLVERYAWFIPRGKEPVNTYPYMQLLTHDTPASLTPLGILYTQFSSFDKSAYADLAAGIPAQQYTALSDNGIKLRVAEDKTPYIAGWMADQWLQYQTYSAGGKLQITYASIMDCKVQIDVDGQMVAEETLPRSGGLQTFTTCTTGTELSKGCHTIRLLLTYGGCHLKQISLAH